MSKKVQYAVKKIDMSKVDTLEEYWKAVIIAPIHYCNGIKELDAYCGGRLPRQRDGYAGFVAGIEYIATRIS